VNCRVANGTRNFVEQPAMTPAAGRRGHQRRHRARAAPRAAGYQRDRLRRDGHRQHVGGRLRDEPPDRPAAGSLHWPRHGLDDAGVARKRDILARALARHPDATDPLDVLATFGGFEIAAMTGAYLAAAASRMVILVDGFIASAALLVAARIDPERAAVLRVLALLARAGPPRAAGRIQAEPLLALDLRLGEGTGAALAWPLVASAVAFLREMATFSGAGVSNASAEARRPWPTNSASSSPPSATSRACRCRAAGGWVGFEPHYLNAARATSRWWACWLALRGAGDMGRVSLWSPSVAIVLGMAATLLLTGAFHEDGLADCVDAFGGGYRREDVLAIMHDSRVGAFGAIAIVVALLLKWQLLVSVAESGGAMVLLAVLVAAHGASRAMAITFLATHDYVRAEGKAKPVAQRLAGVGLVFALACGVCRCCGCRRYSRAWRFWCWLCCVPRWVRTSCAASAAIPATASAWRSSLPNCRSTWWRRHGSGPDPACQPDVAPGICYGARPETGAAGQSGAGADRTLARRFAALTSGDESGGACDGDRGATVRACRDASPRNRAPAARAGFRRVGRQGVERDSARCA
jgi:cobalamin synthase